MFSKSGPFISTGDVDGDGETDFYVGGAAGQSGALYVQKNGKFSKKENGVFESDKKYEDMGSALFDADRMKILTFCCQWRKRICRRIRHV